MNSRVNRFLVALLLALTAFACGFLVDISIGFGHAVASLLRGLGSHAGEARLTWDDWFLGMISAASAVGMIGLLVRKQWGRVIAQLALGTFGIWAAVVALMPAHWRGDLFFTWIDRWAAVIVAFVTLAGFTWLCSRQARTEFQRPEAAT